MFIFFKLNLISRNFALIFLWSNQSASFLHQRPLRHDETKICNTFGVISNRAYISAAFLINTLQISSTRVTRDAMGVVTNKTTWV